MSETSPLRALVVDDDVLVRQATARALTQEGFVCDVAADGKQAMEKLRERTFDVAISDLRMPEMNGHRLVVEMLAMESRPAIMVLTGVAEPKLVRDLLARGVEDVVAKPANYQVLVLKAKALAERRRLPKSEGARETLSQTHGSSRTPEDGANTFEPTSTRATTEPERIQNPTNSVPRAQDPQSSFPSPHAEAPGNQTIAQTGRVANAANDGSGSQMPPLTSPTAVPVSNDTALAELERVADQVNVVCRGLKPPPVDYDAFRLASCNSFGIKELTEAIQVKPIVAGDVLLLANCVLFRASEQISGLEHAQSQRGAAPIPGYCYALCAGSLVLGILIGCSTSFLF